MRKYPFVRVAPHQPPSCASSLTLTAPIFFIRTLLRQPAVPLLRASRRHPQRTLPLLPWSPGRQPARQLATRIPIRLPTL